LPSQVPSCPQVVLASTWQSLGSLGFTPAATIVHVPSDIACEQVWQVPWQALLQQYPSTQNLLLHWAEQLHARPLSRFALLHEASEPGRASVVPPSGGLTAPP
jgi:hypothetical protein